MHARVIIAVAIAIAVAAGLFASLWLNGSSERVTQTSKILASPTIIEFGKVPVFSKRHASVTIENTSAETMELWAASSCGCTVAELRNSTLTGHAQTKLDVLFVPRNPTRPARHVETVRVMWRSPGGPLVGELSVDVVADVESLVQVTPPRVDIGDVTEFTWGKVHSPILFSADSSLWNGQLEIAAPVNVTTRVEQLPAAEGKCRTVVHLGANPEPFSQGSKTTPTAIAEILRLECEVNGESLEIVVPVTARYWRGGCYAQPATCYLGCVDSTTRCTAAFTVTDTRPAPDWASARVNSDTLAIHDVRTRQLSDLQMRFEIDIKPVEGKDSHLIDVSISDQKGDVSNVPVRVIPYLRKLAKGKLVKER